MGRTNAKRNIVLRPRLDNVLSMLGQADTVADIGCDHGRLSVAILQSGAARRVIASDISPASLEKANALAQVCHVSDRLQCRVSDGFASYSDGEAHKAVIAGMGGELIASILNKHESVARALSTIVMQPMRGEAELRSYLYRHSYHIIEERVVFDAGRYYQLISAASGSPEPLPDGWPEGYYQFGPMAFKKRDPLLLKLMEHYSEVLKSKLARAAQNGCVPRTLEHETECVEQLIEIYHSAYPGRHI